MIFSWIPIYIYIYIYKSRSVAFIVTTLLLSHIIHLFFIFSFLVLNFSSPNSQQKKTLLLPISSHLLLHFFQLFSSILASLSPHYFMLYHYTSFILLSFLYLYSSSPYFILFKFNIISPIQSIFFPHKNVSTLSLSLLSFGGFLFFLITLIKVDGFFFPIRKAFFFPFIPLIDFFWLILKFFWK